MKVSKKTKTEVLTEYEYTKDDILELIKADIANKHDYYLGHLNSDFKVSTHISDTYDGYELNKLVIGVETVTTDGDYD